MAASLPLNRRAVLCSMGAAAAVSSLPVAAALPKAADRSAWDAAMRHLAECKAAVEAESPRVDRVHDAYTRLREKVRHAVIAFPQNGSHSTAEDWAVRWARQDRKSARFVEAAAYDHHRANVMLADAADARDARLQRIDERLGWTATNDRHDALVERMCNAQEALVRLPAPDGEALMWKVEQVWPVGDTIWNDDREEQVHADLRRFLLGVQ